MGRITSDAKTLGLSCSWRNLEAGWHAADCICTLTIMSRPKILSLLHKRFTTMTSLISLGFLLRISLMSKTLHNSPVYIAQPLVFSHLVNGLQTICRLSRATSLFVHLALTANTSKL